MKVAKDFDLREFVPPKIWAQYGERSAQFLDPRVFAIAQAYRDFFGASVTVNDWHTKGQRTESGFRMPDTKTGGYLSQHKQGRAFDCRIAGISPQDAFKAICANFAHFKTFGLTTLEDVQFTPTWVHSDCRFTGQDDLLIVKP